MKEIVVGWKNWSVFVVTILYAVSCVFSFANVSTAASEVSEKTSNLSLSFQPLHGQTGVEIDSQFLVVFSEAIKLANGEAVTSKNAATMFHLQSASDQTKVETQVKWSPTYKRLTIQPKSHLAYATKYVLTIPAGKVKTKSGTVNDFYRVEVTTEHLLPPLTITVDPKHKDKDVPLETNITLTFNKEMFLTSKKKITESSIPTFIKLTDSKKKKVPFSGKWDEKNWTITLDPTGNLEPGSEHTITLLKDKLQDSQGAQNPEKTYTFTTVSPADTIAPSITSTPAHGAKDVSLTDSVVLQFAEDVVLANGDSLSNKTVAELVSFEDRQGKKVSYYATWNKSKRTITLRIKGKLSSYTAYAVKLSAGSVKDLAGNKNKSFSVSFSTAGK